MRAHFYRPIQDNMGNIIPNVQVTIYEPGTTTPISDSIYADDSSASLLSNPFISSTGIIDFFLDNPERVRIGIVQGSLPVSYLEDQDVLAASSDSPHIGVGGNSTQIGVGGSSTGSNSVALGYQASSAGTSGTALGSSSSANANQTTAVGSGATSNGVGGTSVGNNTSTNAAGSTALGNNASTGADVHSSALGADAETDDDNQVMVGTAADSVVIPGTFVIADSTGSRWQVSVGTDGTLSTTAL